MEYTASQRIAYLPLEQLNLRHALWLKYAERCVCMGKETFSTIWFNRAKPNKSIRRVFGQSLPIKLPFFTQSRYSVMRNYTL